MESCGIPQAERGMPCRNVEIPTVTKVPNALVANIYAPTPELLNGSCSAAVVYLHGFPDLSINPDTKDFASRLPRKLCELVLATVPATAFVCFNFSGVVGSDTGISFYDKTVSQEVCT